MRIAFTGSRVILPEHEGLLVRALSSVFAEGRNIDMAHSGGAIGFDTMVAQWAKRAPFPHTLHVPMQYQMETLDNALHGWRTIDHFQLCDTCGPHPDNSPKSLYQRRNEHMVDCADLLLAYYRSPEKGGTRNCIDYALRKGTPVYNLLTGTYINA